MIIETFIDNEFKVLDGPYPEFSIIRDIIYYIGSIIHKDTERICIIFNGSLLDPETEVNSLNLQSSSRLRYIITNLFVDVASLHPEQGFTSGGTRVTLVGSFPDASARYTAKFGVGEVSAQYISPTTLITQTPPHPPGPVSVTVKMNDGKFNGGDVLFSYMNRVTHTGEMEVQCLDHMSYSLTNQRFASGTNGI
ncbi:IPT/TIG domain-containing protein [Entamoeba marina]